MADRWRPSWQQATAGMQPRGGGGRPDWREAGGMHATAAEADRRGRAMDGREEGSRQRVGERRRRQATAVRLATAVGSCRGQGDGGSLQACAWRRRQTAAARLQIWYASLSLHSHSILPLHHPLKKQPKKVHGGLTFAGRPRRRWRGGRGSLDRGGSSIQMRLLRFGVRRETRYFWLLSLCLAHPTLLALWMAHLLDLIFSLLYAKMRME